MRLLRFCFFVPLAALLVHCTITTRSDHDDDNCVLDDPRTCHGNEIYACHPVQAEELTVQNRWGYEPCGNLEICVDPSGGSARCVARPCASDVDCDKRGLCRNGACAGYFGSYEECGADPARCGGDTMCATKASGQAEGGALVPCDGTGCECFSR